jgi:glutamine amidotransferase
MIVIIDYEMGNTGALIKMFTRLGYNSKVSNEKSEIEKASHLVLPGVGSFSRAVQKIDGIRNLRPVLNDVVLSKNTPILGICLGMQLLLSSSEEGEGEGFGWISGSVRKFDSSNGLRIPHMGWNIVNPVIQHPLTAGLEDKARFYFVHSFYAELLSEKHSVMTTNYGNDFASVIATNNVMGVQFHPEKSHKYGLKLLNNFVAEN